MQADEVRWPGAAFHDAQLVVTNVDALRLPGYVPARRLVVRRIESHRSPYTRAGRGAREQETQVGVIASRLRSSLPLALRSGRVGRSDRRRDRWSRTRSAAADRLA